MREGHGTLARLSRSLFNRFRVLRRVIDSNALYMRRFTSTLQAWHKIVLFSAHVQINLGKLITSS